MDYAPVLHPTHRTIIPYDVSIIAHDLRVHPNRVRNYWHGTQNGKPFTVPPQTVYLCQCLLALKQSSDLVVSVLRRQPHLVDTLEPVLTAMTKRRS